MSGHDTSRFAEDRSSGSSSVADRFLTELEHWLSADRSPSAPALRTALLAWLRAAQAAQPSLALVHQLSARALSVANTAVSRGESPVDARDSLARSCEAEREDLINATRAASKLAAELVPQNDAWIATLSSSVAVAETVRLMHRLGRRPRVMVAESRPNLEGRDMAAALAADGIPVWLVADAALPMLTQQAAAVLLGSDALTEHGALNKIGSYMAALAAREHGVPTYAIGVRKKLVPAGTAALAITEHPPGELWDTPPQGVRPRNVYFELVPVALLRGVVVEDAVLGPAELAIAARDRALPPELAGAVEKG